MITALHIFQGKVLYSVTRKAEDETLGALLMTETDGWCRLTSLYVAPQCRGRGIARKLMREAINHRPAKTYYLEADSFSGDPSEDGLTDEQLKQFYCSLGFEKVDGTPYLYELKPRA